MTLSMPKIDPKLDLVLDRVVDVPTSLVWKAWTDPEHLKHWFVPKPWTISDAQIDLRPGGVFGFTMHSPEGESFPNQGCYLEVVPEHRLVWTDTMLPGYRPSANPFFTAYLFLEPQGKGTRYVAIAVHGTAESRQRHEEMGFQEGWGTVLDQLVEYIKSTGG